MDIEKTVDIEVALSLLLEETIEQGSTDVILRNPTTGQEITLDLTNTPECIRVLTKALEKN